MKKNLVSATHFYNYVQCPQKIYLDLWGDEKKKLKISDFLQNKIKAGLSHEKDVILDLPHLKVDYKDEEEGFNKTLGLMRRGEEVIYQGVLLHDDLLGRPDLLIKEKGKSKLGNHYYIAVEIKSGKNLKKEYRIQVVFYDYLLSKIQGVLPSKGYIINFEKEKIGFDISKEEYDAFKKTLREIRILFEQEKKMDFSLSSSCSECVWRNHCLSVAEKKKDLSLIHKLGHNAKKNLVKQKISDYQKLAKTNPNSISLWKGVTHKGIKRWVLQSKSLVEKKFLVLKKPEFKKVRYDVFFDIEGEPSLGIDYLYGLIIRDNQKEVEKYFSFFGKTSCDEKSVWKSFLEEIRRLGDDFIIYHYTSYEKSSIKRMKKRYGYDEKLISRIEERFVDVFSVLTRNVVLPVYSYSIKNVAKHLGFSWSKKGVGGALSMFWYAKYLEGEKKYKDLIVEYNKDDCQATLVVKDWLSNL
ncbi:TM0106 family RecB-like putative nuclease [Candidatus Woesearchaeota archaeon]|nr:TM0106 family RecB-like putative nuclease [Candidatus Woesearchaeota archaeon]